MFHLKICKETIYDEIKRILRVLIIFFAWWRSEYDAVDVYWKKKNSESKESKSAAGMLIS